jgi:hypothetical protein
MNDTGRDHMTTKLVALYARGSTLNHGQNPEVQLRLKRGMAEKLFAIPRFQNISTEDLIHAAQKKVAGRKPRKGIVISDRATAIALLMGAAGCEEGQR